MNSLNLCLSNTTNRLIAAAVLCMVATATTPAYSAVIDFIVKIHDQPTTPEGESFAFDLYVKLNPDEFTANRSSGFRGIANIYFQVGGIHKNIDSFEFNPDLALLGFQALTVTDSDTSISADAYRTGVYTLGLEDVTVDGVTFAAGEAILFGSGVYTPDFNNSRLLYPVFKSQSDPVPGTAALYDGVGTHSFTSGVTKSISYETISVPEPASIALLGLGALAFSRSRRRAA